MIIIDGTRYALTPFGYISLGQDELFQRRPMPPIRVQLDVLKYRKYLKAPSEDPRHIRDEI